MSHWHAAALMTERQHRKSHRPPPQAGLSTIASTAELAERGLACCVAGPKNPEYRYFRRLLGLWSRSLKGPARRQPQHVKPVPQDGHPTTPSGSSNIDTQQVVSATAMGSEFSSVKASSQGSAVASRTITAASEDAGTPAGHHAPAGPLPPLLEAASPPHSEHGHPQHALQRLKHDTSEQEAALGSTTISISTAERLQLMHELQLQQETILRMLQSAALPTSAPATPGNSSTTLPAPNPDIAPSRQQSRQLADNGAVVAVNHRHGPAYDSIRLSGLTIKDIVADGGRVDSGELPSSPQDGYSDVQVLSPTSAGRAAAAALAGTSAAAGQTHSNNSSVRSSSRALALFGQAYQQQQLLQQGMYASPFRHTTEFDPFVSSSRSSSSNSPLSNKTGSSALLAAAAAAMSNSCRSSFAGQEQSDSDIEQIPREQQQHQQPEHMASAGDLNAAVQLFTASAAATAVENYNSGHHSAAAQYLIAAAAAAHFQNYVNPLSGLNEPLGPAELDDLAQDLADDESSIVALTDIYLKRISRAGSEIEPLLQDLLATSDQYAPHSSDAQQQQQMLTREQRLLQLLRHLDLSHDEHEPVQASTASSITGDAHGPAVARSSISSVPILPPPTPTATRASAVQGYTLRGSIESSRQQFHKGLGDAAAAAEGDAQTPRYVVSKYSVSLWDKSFLDCSSVAAQTALLLNSRDVGHRRSQDTSAARDQSAVSTAAGHQQQRSRKAAKWWRKAAARQSTTPTESTEERYFSTSDAASTASDIVAGDTTQSDDTSRDSLGFTDNFWSEDGSGGSSSRRAHKSLSSKKQAISSAAAERDSSSASRATQGSGSAWLSGLLWPVPEDVEVLQSPQQRHVGAAAGGASSSRGDVVGLLLRSLAAAPDRAASSHEHDAQQQQQQSHHKEQQADVTGTAQPECRRQAPSERTPRQQQQQQLEADDDVEDISCVQQQQQQQQITPERQRQLLAALLASTSTVHTATAAATAADMLSSPASASTLSPPSPGVLQGYYHHNSPSAAAAAGAGGSPLPKTSSGDSAAELMHNPLFEPVERLLSSLAYSDPVLMNHQDLQFADHDVVYDHGAYSHGNLLDAAAGLSEPSQMWLQDIQDQLQQQRQQLLPPEAGIAEVHDDALQQWQQPQRLHQSPRTAAQAAAAVAGHLRSPVGAIINSADSGASDVLGRLTLDVMELNSLLQSTDGSLDPALVEQLKELMHNETFVMLTQHVHTLLQQQQQQQQHEIYDQHPPAVADERMHDSERRMEAAAAAATLAAAPFASVASLRALNIDSDDPGCTISSDSVLLGSPAFSKSKNSVSNKVAASSTSSRTVQGYSPKQKGKKAAAAGAAFTGAGSSNRAIDSAAADRDLGSKDAWRLDANSPKTAALTAVAAQLQPQQQQQQQQSRELSRTTTFSSNFSAAAPYVSNMADAFAKTSIASSAAIAVSTDNQAAAAAAAAASLDHAAAMAALRERVRLQLEQQSYDQQALRAMSGHEAGLSQHNQQSQPPPPPPAAASQSDSRKTTGVQYSVLPRSASKPEHAGAAAPAHEQALGVKHHTQFQTPDAELRTMHLEPAEPISPCSAAAAAAAGISPGEIISRSVSPVSLETGGESSDDDLLAGIGPSAAAAAVAAAAAAAGGGGSSHERGYSSSDNQAGGSSGDRRSAMTSQPDSISSLEALSLADLRELLSRVAKASLNRLRRKQQQQRKKQRQASQQQQEYDLDSEQTEQVLYDAADVMNKQQGVSVIDLERSLVGKQQQQQGGESGSDGSSAAGSAFSFRHLASLHAASTEAAATQEQQQQRLSASVESLPRPRARLQKKPVPRKAVAAKPAAAAAAAMTSSSEIEPLLRYVSASALEPSVAPAAEAWEHHQQQQKQQQVQAEASNASSSADKFLPCDDDECLLDSTTEVHGVSSGCIPLTPIPTQQEVPGARGSTDNSAASLIQALRLLAQPDSGPNSPVHHRRLSARHATSHPQRELSSAAQVEQEFIVERGSSGIDDEQEVNIESLSLSQLGAILRAARTPRQRRRQVPDGMTTSMSHEDWRDHHDGDHDQGYVIRQQQQRGRRKCGSSDHHSEIVGIRSAASTVDDQGVDQTTAAAGVAATTGDAALQPSH